MVKQVESVKEILGGCGYVELYVSTDAGEATAILSKSGQGAAYINLSLVQMAEARRLLGFMPMSKARIQVNGAQSTERLLESMIVAFRAEELNVAVANDVQTRALVSLSDRYRNPGFNYPRSIVTIVNCDDVAMKLWQAELQRRDNR